MAATRVRMASSSAGAVNSFFGLPTAPDAWLVEDLLSVMRSDKKNVAGKLRFVLLTRLGEVGLVDDVREDEIRTVLG